MTSSTLPSNCRLVNIGTHDLALYTHGPAPTSTSTAVAFFLSGISSDSLNWQVVTRKLSHLSLRSYTYDRSGYRNSSPSPQKPSSQTIASELSLLLKNAEIKNPLILVCHSWAGVLVLEYLALEGVERVAGLVLVDANHETAPLVLNVNDPILWSLAKGIDVYTAWGLTTNHKLTQQEWQDFIAAEATQKFADIAKLEDENYLPSFKVLRDKKLSKKQFLLGDKPLFVIGGTRSRDWKGLYDAGVAKGNGTEEQRRYVRDLIDSVDDKTRGLMREFLKLSRKSQLVFAEDSGHFVQMFRPDIVVEGIRWVLDNQ